MTLYALTQGRALMLDRKNSLVYVSTGFTEPDAKKVSAPEPQRSLHLFWKFSIGHLLYFIINVNFTFT